jgi:hypothetical protein
MVRSSDGNGIVEIRARDVRSRLKARVKTYVMNLNDMLEVTQTGSLNFEEVLVSGYVRAV